jgi:phosphoribosylcarboxyaminoimidazole (NCAIR) mutase
MDAAANMLGLRLETVEEKLNELTEEERRKVAESRALLMTNRFKQVVME